MRVYGEDSALSAFGYRHSKRARRYSVVSSTCGSRPTKALRTNASRVAARAERLAHRLPGLFVALDEEGRVVVWNELCERLTGWTLAEVRSDAGRLFPDAQYRNRIAAEWKERNKLPLYHDWEWRVACKDGSYRTFSWTSCHVFGYLCPWYCPWHTLLFPFLFLGGGLLNTSRASPPANLFIKYLFCKMVGSRLIVNQPANK